MSATPIEVQKASFLGIYEPNEGVMVPEPLVWSTPNIIDGNSFENVRDRTFILIRNREPVGPPPSTRLFVTIVAYRQVEFGPVILDCANADDIINAESMNVYGPFSESFEENSIVTFLAYPLGDINNADVAVVRTPLGPEV